MIGSRWKEIDYLKALPKASNKPPSEAQLAQRGSFKHIQEWLTPFRPFINLGLMYYSGKMTALNAAHSLNSKNVSGTLGNFTVNREDIVLSHGDLAQAADLQVVTEPGLLHVTWNSDGRGHAHQVLLAIQVPDLEYTDFVFSGACRGDGRVTFRVPEVAAGLEAFGYIAFSSLDRKKASTSQYLGAFTVQ